MNSRIAYLAEKTVKGELWTETVAVEYDPMDILLSPIEAQAKRTREYILNQEPRVLPENALTGYLRFDGSIPGDIFNRTGHENFLRLRDIFYAKPVNNLTTFEWQHSVADYEKVIKVGISGLIEEIQTSKEKHTDPARLEFLDALETVAHTIVDWAHKCALKAEKVSAETNDPEYKENLMRLASALRKVPEHSAKSFYEAILTVYVIYAFVPDSIGTIDRYLYPFYLKDISSGALTREKAKEYLAELFLMLQARISIESDRFYRGGESHFCIGGYLPNGEDGYNELSELVLETLMELPTWIPQVSLRWTKKTPHSVLRNVLDMSRKDPNNRIAFVSDEPRIKGFMEYAELSYEDAVSYTMVGCNEPALPGGQILGVDTTNAARCLGTVFHKRCDDIIKAESFDEFYGIFEEEISADLKEAIDISEAFQRVRARDCNIVSSMFFRGCIENAKSMTEQDSMTKYSAVATLIGLTTVIDSLSITKQLVYDEKIINMKELTNALAANWKGYEELHSFIVSKGHFFGNDDDLSNEVAKRVVNTLRTVLGSKDNYWRKKMMVGDLIGYNQHNKWFGDELGATPDGRYAGDSISFGRGTYDGRDKEGLTALMNSVVKYDEHCLLTGPSVTNMLLDEKILTDDYSFEKFVSIIEAYFMMGGLHAQFNFVSEETLKDAKINPEKHKNLRVRVSGFSDYFNNLNSDLQDEIITRTQSKIC